MVGGHGPNDNDDHNEVALLAGADSCGTGGSNQMAEMEDKCHCTSRQQHNLSREESFNFE